jgi:hypothetical protein
MAGRIALLTAHVDPLFGIEVNERKYLGLQELDFVALTGLNRLIEQIKQMIKFLNAGTK